DLVNRQINNIRAAGLLGVVDVDAILTQEAILSPSGDAVMERSRAKVADAEGVSQQAKKTTLAALEAL
ncbi:MAG: hypothetical protein GTO49_07980, partial [Anaerolineae bacterium]|nr:hypothetical protein [Anaerolineae bacterium]